MPELEIMSISQRLGTAMVALFAITFTRAPRLVRFANPMMRRLLVTRLPAGPNVLLEVRGRTSGLPRTFPVAYLDLGDRSYVQGASGDVDWVRNLRAAGECLIVRAGRARRGNGWTPAARPARAVPAFSPDPCGCRSD